MPKDFLMYWKWKTNRLEDDDWQIVDAVSDQFERVHPGDTLWLVTIPPDSTGHTSMHFVLLGRLRVRAIVDRPTAVQMLGTDDIYADADLIAVAEPGTEERIQHIDIAHLAPYIRFNSPKDRLTITDSKVNPQALQSLRELTADSVALLDECLHGPSDEGGVGTGDGSTHGPLASTEDDESFPEGRQLLRTHLVRERRPALVKLAKQRFKDQHDGRLFCQACGFDFSATYGPLGEDYIEAHHTVPVSQLVPGSQTRVEDLAMVCANCHRMLHRRRPWLTMPELAQILTPAHAGARLGH